MNPALERNVSISKEQATTEFWRMMKWIAVAAILMVAAALVFLAALGALSTHAVVATVLGVFISVLLGSGLFALAFVSDKSGHDEEVGKSTKRTGD